MKPSEVPSLLRKLDAGIIPYICSEINKNVYPLKINEFLAVGVPVVMTRFADLPEFSQYVGFAGSKEDFCRLIDREIRNDSVERIAERVKFARTNSWEAKVNEFAQAILTFIKS